MALARFCIGAGGGRVYNRQFQSKSAIWPAVMVWVVVFVGIMAAFPQDGGGNEAARLALVTAMVEQQTFAIDAYQWSGDWAKSPNGHYYSNKPPGPALLGTPLYWALSHLPGHQMTAYSSEAGRVKGENFSLMGYLLSLVLQVIPFAIVLYLMSRWLAQQGVSVTGQLLAVAAAGFGTTATLFMNTFFGHGMAAVWVLVTVLSVLNQRYVLAGLFFGLALLTDYAAAVLVLPFVVFIVLWSSVPWKAVGYVLVGGIIPAGLWGWYHYVSFGSVFRTATSLANPVFREQDSARLWGIFGVPDGEVFVELLIGSERGILLFMPWIVVVIIAAMVVWKRVRPDKMLLLLIVWSVAGLLGVLLLNSSFNNWLGGDSPGPRYMALVMPSVAILLGYVFDQGKWWLKTLFIVSVIPSIVFTAGVLATSILGSGGPLWVHYFEAVTSSGAARERFVTIMVIFMISVALSVYFQRWRRRMVW